jgi:uncharacterized C2H2 Zn-finger protein
MEIDDEVGSATIHCIDCGLHAGVKASDLPSWEVLGCPQCGEGVNPHVDLGTGHGSVDTAVHNDDGSITCNFCEAEIRTEFQVDELGEIRGVIMREGRMEIHDCPSCDRAFRKMKEEGVLSDES